MVRLLALPLTAVAGLLLLSGCATGVKGSPRRICYDSGLQPGSPEFSRCWRNVAHQQGTLVYDDPEFVAIMSGAIQATAGASAPTARTSPAPGDSPARPIAIQQLNGKSFSATRIGDDLYQLGYSTYVQTRYCHTYANRQPVVIFQQTMAFQCSSATCAITAAWSR
jgi:hypothetical protein